MPRTGNAPQDTVLGDGRGSGSPRSVVIDDSSLKVGHLVKPKTGTYGNGVEGTESQHGSDNDGEGIIEIIEIEPDHPQSNTPYDKTTALSSGDGVTANRLQIDKSYWVRAESAFTGTAGAKLICGDAGTVETSGNFNATPVNMHWFVLELDASLATWLFVTYKGEKMFFTTSV